MAWTQDNVGLDSSLTEDVVKGWISTELAASKMITNAEKWIESKKNPPTPIKVSKTLPW